MKQLPCVATLLALMLTAAACAPAATPGPAASPQAAAQHPAPIQRTLDRKSTRLNSSHSRASRMPSSA